MIAKGFLGIDVGAGGGIAMLDEDGQVVALCKMPETDTDLLTVVADMRSNRPTTRAVRGMVERVRSSPQMGVVSAFSFGGQYRACKMALLAAGIPFDEVLPQAWQKAMGCLTKGDKNISKARAQELFPGVKCNHAVSDALLISEFCRRQWVNK